MREKKLLNSIFNIKGPECQINSAALVADPPGGAEVMVKRTHTSFIF